MNSNSCRVCGDHARFYFYGGLSCSPCKIFFRRNAYRPKFIRPCDQNGHCDITIHTRNACTTCRLAKCYAIGMKSEQIRKEDLSKIQCQQRKLLLLPLNLLQTDQSSLTTSDWTLLSNVVHAFDIFNPLIKIRSMIEHTRSRPNLEISMNLMNTIFSSVESFIHSTPDFRIMTNEEQHSLIERNIQGLWSFHSCLTFHQSQLFDQNENAILPLYGFDNVQQTKRITQQLDHDITLLKLMLMIFAFSSNLFTVIERKNFPDDGLLLGTFRIFGSQNVYLTIIWQYMIYRYGFSETVKRFAALVKTLLDMIRLASDITDSNTTHRQLVGTVIEQTKQTIDTGIHENSPLWGKI